MGQRQGQVGGGNSFTQAANEVNTDHVGDYHVQRLAEHGGGGFDAAHSPTQHAQPVDHGGVRIRTHQRIREGQHFAVVVAGQHNLGQIFQVDLVDDTGGGWHDAQIFENSLPQVQELIALTVALVFFFHVALQRIGQAGAVHLNGVVDDQIDGQHGVDERRVSTQAGDSRTHGRQIHDHGHAGEILQ